MYYSEAGLRLNVPKGVFYNPLMAPDRWLSTRLIGALLPPGSAVLDLLCASGARGLQYACAGFKVHLNDASPTAVKAAKANAKANGLKASFSNQDGKKFLLETSKRFDCIDIDPFGSPSPFLQAATKALAPRGLLFLTATDLGALQGRFSGACKRRYGVDACWTSFAPELACRNLIFAAAISAEKRGRGFEPVFCYARRHYVRVFLRKVGKPTSSGWIAYCPKCENRALNKKKRAGKCACGNALSIIGPTWIGPLGDAELARQLYEQTGEPLLEVFAEECSIRQPYWDLHALARANGKEAESTEAAIRRLRKKGFQASRTIFSGHGLRTDAPAVF